MNMFFGPKQNRYYAVDVLPRGMILLPFMKVTRAGQQGGAFHQNVGLKNVPKSVPLDVVSYLRDSGVAGDDFDWTPGDNPWAGVKDPTVRWPEEDRAPSHVPPPCLRHSRHFLAHQPHRASSPAGSPARIFQHFCRRLRPTGNDLLLTCRCSQVPRYIPQAIRPPGYFRMQKRLRACRTACLQKRLVIRLPEALHQVQ